MGLQICRLGWVRVDGERNWVGRGIGWGEHWERRGRRGEAVMTPGKWDGGRRSCAQMEERTEAKGLRERMGAVLGKEVEIGGEVR